MKTFLTLCAAAGLAGCAVYPTQGDETYRYDVPAPRVIQPPVYIYGGDGGGAVYRSDGLGYAYPRDYHRPVPLPPVVVVPGPRPGRPFVYIPRPGRGDGDRDGDGIPDRFDRWPNHSGPPSRVERSRGRDRDGDGIPDRFDRWPNRPNRR